MSDEHTPDAKVCDCACTPKIEVRIDSNADPALVAMLARTIRWGDLSF